MLLAALGTAGALLLPGLLLSSTAAAVSLDGALLLGPLAVGLGGLGLDRRAPAGSAARRPASSGWRRSATCCSPRCRRRADELDLATRMLAARAQTMTSVIDAVTEQSIIGTDLDGVIRVWNPGAEKMLGLPRPDVVRKRSILEFHLPEELGADDDAAGTGLAALVHAAAGARQRRPGLDLRGRRRAAAHRLGRRSPRAPTTRARTPAGTSSAPT